MKRLCRLVGVPPVLVLCCFLMQSPVGALSLIDPQPTPARRRGLTKPQPGAAKLQKKLREIVIPRISFEEANVADVIRHLVKLSKEFDPEGEGINIILRDPAAGRFGARAPGRNTRVQADDLFPVDVSGATPDADTKGGGGLPPGRRGESGAAPQPARKTE